METQRDPDAHRALIHQINNLLGVIYTQAAVARVEGSAEKALEALDLIERAALETGEVVKRARS